METLLGSLVLLVVMIAFAFGWQSYKNAILVKQVESIDRKSVV